MVRLFAPRYIGGVPVMITLYAICSECRCVMMVFSHLSAYAFFILSGEYPMRGSGLWPSVTVTRQFNKDTILQEKKPGCFLPGFFSVSYSRVVVV